MPSLVTQSKSLSCLAISKPAAWRQQTLAADTGSVGPAAASVQQNLVGINQLAPQVFSQYVS